MARDKQVIISGVRRRIEADRPRINVDKGPHQPPVEVTLASFEYQITFIKPCKAAAVTVEYVWQIKGPQMAPVNSRKKRTLGCVKS